MGDALKRGMSQEEVDAALPEIPAFKTEAEKAAQHAAQGQTVVGTQAQDMTLNKADVRFTDVYRNIPLEIGVLTVKSAQAVARVPGPFHVIQANGTDLFVHRSYRIACMFADLFNAIPHLGELVNAVTELSLLEANHSGLPGPDGKPPEKPTHEARMRAAMTLDAAVKRANEYMANVFPILCDVTRETHDFREAKKRGGGPIGEPRRPSGLVGADGRPL